ncbi:hypothetical protein SO802_013483, partial [Lithocarpus litseifolius]
TYTEAKNQILSHAPKTCGVELNPNLISSSPLSTGSPYAATLVISGAGAAAPNLKVIGIAGIKGANRIDLLDLETYDLTIQVALGEMQMTTLIRRPLQDAVLVYCF